MYDKPTAFRIPVEIPRAQLFALNCQRRSAIGWTSESLGLFPMHSPGVSPLILANKLYCTVQYSKRAFGYNLQGPAIQSGLKKEVA
jgi:hypothetical protein